MKNRLTSLFAAILASALLAACGGGGAKEQPCSSSTSLLVGLSYTSTKISGGNLVQYDLGVPFTSTPTVTGVPASCSSGKRFSIAAQGNYGVTTNLPSTVTIDPFTGTIAGTLAVPIGICYGQASPSYANSTSPVCAGGGLFASSVFVVTMTLPGYSPVTQSVNFINQLGL